MHVIEYTILKRRARAFEWFIAGLRFISFMYVVKSYGPNCEVENILIAVLSFRKQKGIWRIGSIKSFLLRFLPILSAFICLLCLHHGNGRRSAFN